MRPGLIVPDSSQAGMACICFGRDLKPLTAPLEAAGATSGGSFGRAILMAREGSLGAQANSLLLALSPSQ